ncbi:MAG: efflux RND transporter periplasmic adaptor subunit [Actinomycetia bacterium]|nr:efflux RND transporter periplasmic adaptor subunit [Actinomycetes bacterium]
MKRKYKIQILNLTLIIFLITLIVISFTACRKAAPKFETFKVERGDIVESVTASGSVDSSEVKNYSLQVSGKVLDVLKKGETFKSGQVLISVDNRRNEILVSQAEKSLAVAENSLKIAKINYQQALNANHVAIQLSQSNTKIAEQSVQNAYKALEDANILTDASINSAYIAIENAKNYLAEVKSSPLSTPAVIAQAEGNVSSAEGAYEQAKESARSQTDAANSAYKQALANQSASYWNNINSAQTAQTQIKLTGANIKQAQTQLDLSNINLELTKLELDKNQISAPFDGIVSSSTFSDGEFAGTGMTAISVISSQFIIKADINETDISKLNPGQKVEITLDAYLDKLLQGEIAEISPISKNLAGIVSFEIKIKPDDSSQSYLKYGLSANITIIISKVENVLYAPIQSVYEESGKKYVDVLTENNESKKVEITTGNYNYDYIEIKSGLAEGDQIITSKIEAAASANMFGQ